MPKRTKLGKLKASKGHLSRLFKTCEALLDDCIQKLEDNAEALLDDRIQKLEDDAGE